MSHISRSCANAPGWPEEKSGGLRYNDWRVHEVHRETSGGQRLISIWGAFSLPKSIIILWLECRIEVNLGGARMNISCVAVNPLVMRGR